jgi:hypothetical protein
VKLVAVHLWKEWRDHRSAALLVLCGFPALLTLVALLPAPLFSYPAFRQLAAIEAILAMLVAVGGELLGGERRTGRSLLERLPHALPGAFVGRLLFLGLTTLAAGLVGHVTANALAALRGLHADLSLAPEAARAYALLAVLVALWTFAASAWSARGGMALLGGLLTLGVVGAPCWTLLVMGYRPTLLESCVAWSLLAGGAVVGAYVSFVPRRVRGAGQGRVLLYGLLPMPLVALPLCSGGALRLAERSSLDPGRCSFMSPCITRDGRYAFTAVQAFPRGWNHESVPPQVVRIDLGNGSLEVLGEPDARVRALVPEGEHVATTFVVESPSGAVLAFDAQDGAPRASDPSSWPKRWTPAGLGWTRGNLGRVEIVDPLAGRTIGWHELGIESLAQVVVLPGRWLVRHGQRSSWSWFDPETKACQATGWGNDAMLLAVLADGRIVRGDHGRTRAALVAPTTGEESVLSQDGERKDDLRMIRVAYGPEGWPYVFAPGQEPLFSDGRSLWRLDVEAARLTRVTDDFGCSSIVHTAEDGSLVLHDLNAGLLRLDVRTGERCRLFPRPAL